MIKIKKADQHSVLFAVFGFLINLLYAFYNGILALTNHSLWFSILCAYYIVLSSMRFSIVLCNRLKKNNAKDDIVAFVMKLCGILLILLSFILAYANMISLSQNISIKHESIVMITIAFYTFYRITLIIIKYAKRSSSQLLTVIRSISYAEAAASILTLQRSMLVSFGDMSAVNRRIMNMITGAAVCLFVFITGILLIRKGINGKDTSIWQKLKL